ncbi:MAG: DUF502 domain-containing protein [Gammaproteobacteria bacterium]
MSPATHQPTRMKRLRRYLVAGVLIWVPLAVTFFVLRFLVNLADQTLKLIPLQFRPETLLGFNIPGLGIILTLIVLLLTGLLFTNLLGRKVLHFWESVLARIPLIRSVYSSAKQVVETVFSGSGQSFKKVLLVQYPREGLWSIGFQTSTGPGEVQHRTSRDVLCAFIPTTPNPTSGFLIMVPVEDVIVLDMSVEEAMRLIISLGVVVPSWRADEIPVELSARTEA